MSMGRLSDAISRVRFALQNGWADPVVRYGSVFEGYYEVQGSRVEGVIYDASRASKRPPISVILLRSGEPIGSTKSFEPLGDRWRFEIDVGIDFLPDDVLKERLRVIALDRLGGESVMKISGATQLNFIRNAPGSTPGKDQL
jgi:hypothetical protein